MKSKLRQKHTCVVGGGHVTLEARSQRLPVEDMSTSCAASDLWRAELNATGHVKRTVVIINTQMEIFVR